MLKTIKVDSEVFTRLLTKKSELVTKNNGRNLSFSEVIGKVLENG